MAADTDQLLDLAAAGDDSAVARLLTKHRSRLRALVNWRMDPRIAGQCDPSDVVQEALLESDPVQQNASIRRLIAEAQEQLRMALSGRPLQPPCHLMTRLAIPCRNPHSLAAARRLLTSPRRPGCAVTICQGFSKQ